MDRRIQEVLDGERNRDELSPPERSRLERYERVLDGVVTSLEQEPVPDVTPAVMARIAELEVAPRPVRAVATGPGALRRAWNWLWRPRPVTVRPALAGAAALGLVLVAGLLASPSRAPAPPGVDGRVAGGAASEPIVMVHFRLDATEARTVQLAGDFTEWEPAWDMHEVAPGVWSVVVPLSPGVHDYAFVVDGEHWRPDPFAPAVDDGFGGTNSRLALLAPGRGGAS